MPPHSWDIHGLIDTCSNCGESRQWDKTRTNFVVINKGTSTCKAVPTKDFDPTKRKPGRPPATAGRPAGTEAPAPVQEAAGTTAPVQEASAEAPAPKEEAAPALEEKDAAYYLEDGRGPFADVQAAMDELGLDKAKRPQHNRWARLSSELKQKIQRRAKGVPVGQ
ncbi:hypothetical protein LCGC14_1272700 [marine sediment metagenome]|uniref:Uncharacterized protein n=1 Tax=marine sediment metagenome TaxID=412755 RepID=A0A0F9P0L6_9ZZZZ